MVPTDRIAPEDINRIASDVRAGRGDPGSVRSVLSYFCFLIEEDIELPLELAVFLKDVFRTYLDNNAKSLDQAIGLRRKTEGRPPDEKIEVERIILATAVLEARIDGASHQESLEDVAEQHHCGLTKVGEAWNIRKGQALTMVLTRRHADGDDFTLAERDVIQKIYKKSHEKLHEWFSKQPPTIAPDK